MHPSLRSANIFQNMALHLPPDAEGYKTLLGMRAANPAYARFIRENEGVAEALENRFFERMVFRRTEGSIQRRPELVTVFVKGTVNQKPPTRLLPDTPSSAGLYEDYVGRSRRYSIINPRSWPTQTLREIGTSKESQLHMGDVLLDLMNSEHIKEINGDEPVLREKRPSKKRLRENLGLDQPPTADEMELIDFEERKAVSFARLKADEEWRTKSKEITESYRPKRKK